MQVMPSQLSVPRRNILISKKSTAPVSSAGPMAAPALPVAKLSNAEKVMLLHFFNLISAAPANSPQLIRSVFLFQNYVQELFVKHPGDNPIQISIDNRVTDIHLDAIARQAAHIEIALVAPLGVTSSQSSSSSNGVASPRPVSPTNPPHHAALSPPPSSQPSTGGAAELSASLPPPPPDPSRLVSTHGPINYGVFGEQGSPITPQGLQENSAAAERQFPQEASPSLVVASNPGVVTKLRARTDTPAEGSASASIGRFNVGRSHTRNARFRRTMEDTHVMRTIAVAGRNLEYFAVFDGHGGDGTSKFAEQRLHVIIAEVLADKNLNDDTTVANALVSACEKFQQECKGTQHDFHGSTAIVALVINQKLFTIGVGDARALVLHNNQPKQVSYDQKPNNPEELARIRAAGGFVMAGRVNGSLGVARAFGDCAMNPMVTANPFITVTPLVAGDKIVLGCDGVWDKVNNQDVAAICQIGEASVPEAQKDDPLVCAQAQAIALEAVALAKETQDNVSTLVAIFNPSPPPPPLSLIVSTTSAHLQTGGVDPSLVTAVIAATPVFKNYGVGIARSGGPAPAPLTHFTLRPNNRFLSALFGGDVTTMPGEGLYRFRQEVLPNLRQRIESLADSQIVKFSFKGASGSVAVAVPRAGAPDKYDWQLSAPTDLAAYYGPGEFEMSVGEIKSFLRSQRIYPTGFMPPAFYNGLKAAMQQDHIRTLPGREPRKGEPPTTIVTVADLLEGRYRANPEDRDFPAITNLIAFFQQAKTNPVACGLTSEQFQFLSSLTLY